MTSREPGVAGPPATAEPSKPPSRGRTAGFIGRAGILIPFVIAFVALSLLSPSFLRFQNLTNILDQQSGIIIVACAGALVLIAGGIDLSIGATYGLAGAVSLIAATKAPTPVAIAAGLAVGLVVGLVNGTIVTRFRVNEIGRAHV